MRTRPHVRAGAGDPPGGHDAPGSSEAHHRHGAVRAVGDVEPAGVAARIEAVGSGTRAQEADPAERRGVDLPHPTVGQIRDVEHPSVRRQLDILRRGPRPQVDEPDDPLAGNVDHDHLGRELAADQHVAPVCGEVGVVDAGAARNREGVMHLIVRAARKSIRRSCSAITMA